LNVDAVGQRDANTGVHHVRVVRNRCTRGGVDEDRRRWGASAGAARINGEAEGLAPKFLVRLQHDAARVGTGGRAVSTPTKMMSPAPSSPSAEPPVVNGASELNGECERPPWLAGAAASMSTYHTTGPTTSIVTVAVSDWSGGVSGSLSSTV
jgi:hypothetical protein